MNCTHIDEKIRRLERYLEKNPVDIDVGLDLAEDYFHNSYYLGEGNEFLHSSIKEGEEDLKLWPDIQRAGNIIANAFYGVNMLQEVEQHYNIALKKYAENPISFVGLGNISREMGEFRHAKSLFLKAISFNPFIWEAHYNLGCIYLEEGKSLSSERNRSFDFHRAIYHIIKALKSGQFEGFLTEIFMVLGYLLIRTSRFYEAKGVFEQLRSRPKYAPYASYFLGLCNYYLENYYSAIENFKNYLKFLPESSLTYTLIAIYYLQLKNPDKAKKYSDKALEIDPHNLLSRFVKACIYIENKEFDPGIRLLTSILDDFPDYLHPSIELVKFMIYMNDLDFIKSSIHKEVERFDTPELNDMGRFYRGGEKVKGCIGEKFHEDKLISSFSPDERAFKICALNRLHKVREELNFLKEVDKIKSENIQFQAAILEKKKIVSMEGVSRDSSHPSLDPSTVTEKEQRCHICNKKGNEVLKLYVHSNLSLCIECISSITEQAKKSKLDRGRKDDTSCSLCRKSLIEASKIFRVSDRVHLCQACIEQYSINLEKEELDSFFKELF